MPLFSVKCGLLVCWDCVCLNECVADSRSPLILQNVHIFQINVGNYFITFTSQSYNRTKKKFNILTIALSNFKRICA